MMKPGQFIPANFPFNEQPERPGPMRHIGLVLDVVQRGSEIRALIAYTTTAFNPAGPRQQGIIKIAQTQSRQMGMENAFVIDTRRIAVLPLSKDWFPEIDRENHGVKGNASDHLMSAAKRLYQQALEERANVVVLGPRLQARGSGR